MKNIFALGIGHNTPNYIDLAIDCGYEIAGLYHYNEDRTGQIDHGYKVLGSFNDLLSLDSLNDMIFLLTMGDIKIRFNLAKEIISKGGRIPSLIHPSCIISRFANISSVGVYILPYSTVQSDCSVADMTVVLSHVSILHSTTVGKGCFLADCSTIGAYTNIEDFVFFGQGALSISSKVKNIGANAYIGARSLLTRDVPPNTILVGSPARIISKND